MKYLVVVLVLALVALQQDHWLWHNDTLVLGFLPIGLAYHLGISVAAAVVWYVATRVAWPASEEDPRLAP